MILGFYLRKINKSFLTDQSIIITNLSLSIRQNIFVRIH